MKKIMGMILFLSLALTAGCSSTPHWEIVMKTDYTYQQQLPLTIEINENSQPVEGLQVKATLEMEKMDHGEVDVTFEDQGNGQYIGQAALPMGGDWVAYIELTDGKQAMEQTQNLSFKEE
ncbi:FixH family protein [Ammoniphilus resinae]|uniref:Nitrogen fixation protein FixH n=1 Tax=Ammoniphilus resinae TaxID=861532 RepID=A0ABS4GQN8_9BACL|nr:FixH family protein [Ammoniphilus resinae]MBP1932457.1 nitrogen fixation protein FixH [Ammoniphilus resinae]